MSEDLFDPQFANEIARLTIIRSVKELSAWARESSELDIRAKTGKGRDEILIMIIDFYQKLFDLEDNIIKSELHRLQEELEALGVTFDKEGEMVTAKRHVSGDNAGQVIDEKLAELRALSDHMIERLATWQESFTGILEVQKKLEH
jgi:hypothetical protein